MGNSIKPGERTFLRRLPFVESILSLSEQLGVTSVVRIVGPIVGGLLLSVIAWIWSNSPLWALVLIGILGIGATAWTVDRILVAILHSQQLKGVQVIDRASLADEMEKVAKGILALATEHLTLIQAAWWADCNDKKSPMTRKRHTAAEGKLVERYGDKFAADAWRLLYIARKIVPLDHNRVWMLSHSVRGESGISEMGLFLMQTAADVRHGVETEHDGKAK